MPPELRTPALRWVGRPPPPASVSRLQVGTGPVAPRRVALAFRRAPRPWACSGPRVCLRDRGPRVGGPGAPGPAFLAPPPPCTPPRARPGRTARPAGGGPRARTESRVPGGPRAAQRAGAGPPLPCPRARAPQGLLRGGGRDRCIHRRLRGPGLRAPAPAQGRHPGAPLGTAGPRGPHPRARGPSPEGGCGGGRCRVPLWALAPATRRRRPLPGAHAPRSPLPPSGQLSA